MTQPPVPKKRTLLQSSQGTAPADGGASAPLNGRRSERTRKRAGPKTGESIAKGEGDPKPTQGPKAVVSLAPDPGDTDALALARAIVAPGLRHSVAVADFGAQALGPEVERPGLGDYADALAATLERAGDPGSSRRMLAAQAIALDAVFSEMLRRSAGNLGKFPDAADRYLRLALKAQANSRATLEALHRLSEPPPAPPRYVSVRDGGQAVIADQFHHHAGAPILEDQSHATRTIGQGPAMPGENPARWPVPGSEGSGQG
jgi:hypothetical protein